MKKIIHLQSIFGYEVRLYKFILHNLFFFIATIYAFSSLQNIETGEYYFDNSQGGYTALVKVMFIIVAYSYSLYRISNKIKDEKK